MTIEIDLPPLPEPNGSYTNPYDGDDLENYARAVAEHSVAARDAEIERLKVVAHGFVDEIAARDAEIAHERWLREQAENRCVAVEDQREALRMENEALRAEVKSLQTFARRSSRREAQND